MNEKIYPINQRRNTNDIIELFICGITYPDKNYKISRPDSKIACIEYVDKGIGTVHIDNETFYPGAGDSYFLQAGKNHNYFSDKDNPWKKYFINLSGNLVESLTEGYSLKGIYHFKNLDTKAELKEIISLSKDETNDHTDEIICVLNKIFIKMHNAATPKSAASETAEEMKNFISMHQTIKFRMEDLCRHMSLSESHTIRIFKKAYGVTPYAYLTDKRISLAKNMLTNTNLSIKQIAYKLKFADEYYFSNVFKSKVGMSPTEFRKSKSGQ